jgi:hypothetical protein
MPADGPAKVEPPYLVRSLHRPSTELLLARHRAHAVDDDGLTIQDDR